MDFLIHKSKSGYFIDPPISQLIKSNNERCKKYRQSIFYPFFNSCVIIDFSYESDNMKIKSCSINNKRVYLKKVNEVEIVRNLVESSSCLNITTFDQGSISLELDDAKSIPKDGIIYCNC